MAVDLEFFSNDKYKILKLLHNHEVRVKDAVYVSLSQQEIADMAHFSKLKTNRIIKSLISNDFIESYQGIRGKYAITDNGYRALDIMQMNDFSGGTP